MDLLFAGVFLVGIGLVCLAAIYVHITLNLKRFKYEVELMEVEARLAKAYEVNLKHHHEFIMGVLDKTIDALQKTSSEERAHADSLRDQAKAEIDIFRDTARQDKTQLSEEPMIDELRNSLRIHTPDGRILEPIFPGDKF